MKTFFSPDYAASAHAFDTTRKAVHIATSLSDNPIDGVELADPIDFYDATDLLIDRLHDPAYVTAVRTGEPLPFAESQGFDWDPGIYPMARAHNAGLVAAVDHVVRGPHATAGSLSSGLHHANIKWGSGFCTFNGLAVAAQHAHDLGVPEILVLDFDAHSGGGTWDMTRDMNVAQVDVTVSRFDTWDPGDDDKSLLLHATPDTYREHITMALEFAATWAPWPLVLYNAGMDPINARVSANDLAWREKAVAAWVRGHANRTVFALAGGYTWGAKTMDDIVNLHRLTLAAFAG